MVIRPFCITIFHHNLFLFIDIFHIMMQYLCYFILFCMFGNYCRCIHRSLESAGKVPVRTPDFGSPKNSRKIQGNKSRTQKGAKRRATGGRCDPLLRAHLGPRIMMQYLCYSILFCMFFNYWGFICRSPELVGKVPVKTPDFGSPKNSKKIQRSIFSGISHGARRGDRKSVV